MICMEDPGSLDMAVQGQWPAAEQGLTSKGTELVSVISKGTKLVRVTIEILSFHRRLISGLPYITETKKLREGLYATKRINQVLMQNICIADGDKCLSNPFIYLFIINYLI